MKIKNLIAVAALLLGSTTVFAQRNVGEQFPEGNYIYQVTKKMGSKPGELKIIAIRDGKNPVVDGALELKGYLETKVFEDTYKFNVIYAETDALQQTGTTDGTTLTVTGEPAAKEKANKVVIPKEFTKIKADCFEGYTNITEISFEDGSVVSDIEGGAFTTTQISKFDFTPCSKLAALNDEVFVETGKINSYITEIILPENSKLLKNIEAAFMNLPNLKKITNLEKSSITKVVANAFKNDAKLTTIILPATVKVIETDAFTGSGISDLTINVDGLVTSEGGIEPNVYGTTVPVSTLTKLTLKGELGAIIDGKAFEGCNKLATLDMSDLTIISGGQIATNAFKDCVEIKEVNIKAINDTPGTGYTIDTQAFNGCTALTTVTIGSINSAAAIGAKAFGTKLTSVTIGTVKAGGEAIAGGAFKFDDVSGVTLNIAQGAGEYLSSDDAATPIFAANAFDFSAVINYDGSSTFVMPAVKIGEILSKGGVFTGADITVGATLSELTFTGNIASDGIDAFILSSTGAINKITFDGTIETGGIATNAFAGLSPVMTLVFNRDLKEKAIAAGAFEGLPAGSKIYYNCTTVSDNTVNPFDKNAFGAAAFATDPRTILLMAVADEDLKANFQDTDKDDTSLLPLYPGTGLETDGDFDIYLVKWDDTPAPVPTAEYFIAYRNDNEKNVAWARLPKFGWDAPGTIADGSALKIQRVQTLDGATVKITMYGTYTDEDDNLNASTLYMVPLQSINGFYYFNGTETETIIAKVEKKGADITDANKDLQIPVATGDGSSSLWGNLTNTELFIAQNMMTNQQLIDGNATDGTNPAPDIYRGTFGTSNQKISEDLWRMSDPAKYHGFYVKKDVIAKGGEEKGGAYINTGWYYMLLKHYDGAPAAARVIWMDDTEATGIFGIKEVKTVENGVMYNLQGVRISAPVKGQLYIMNGKKYIAK